MAQRSVGILLIVNLLLFLCPEAFAFGQQATEEKKPPAKSNAISITKNATGFVVKAGGNDFAVCDLANFEKPILYPVLGPKQIPMTRRWPMKNVEGEANDHPHHKSIWTGHLVNGMDFWTGKSGTIQQQSAKLLNENSFEVLNHWMAKKDGSQVVEEKTVYSFGADALKRWIDVEISFKATQADVTFDDTKEGTFAIRTHPDLRLKPDKKRGVENVTGKALNSQGTQGPSIWGQSARWVYYYGAIGGTDVGVAFFDHPSNLRHPTTWHAREYGLVAANPFGLHYFKKEKKGAGAFLLKKGKTLRLKYRLVFQLGRWKKEQLDLAFDEYAK